MQTNSKRLKPAAYIATSLVLFGLPFWSRLFGSVALHAAVLDQYLNCCLLELCANSDDTRGVNLSCN